MLFRTQIPISKSNNPLDYHSKVVSLGSCFAENMAEKFDYFKFQNVTNPFGIIFNPISIETVIQRIVKQQFYTEKDLFFLNERWHCFEVHSDLSNAHQEEMLETLNKLISVTHTQIKEATHIIITYGTSWIYRNIACNQIVANCHKVPQKQFSKELLTVDLIQESIQNTITLIQSLNPEITFVFTISPVRHIKDGFVQNQISKAHLFAGLNQVLNTQTENYNYFPSYEIVMDELRDYRFYAEDMLHPNQLAIDYIWQKFTENYMNVTTLPIMQEIADIQRSLHHRSFNPESEQHQKFLLKLQQKIKAVNQKWSHIKF